MAQSYKLENGRTYKLVSGEWKTLSGPEDGAKIRTVRQREYAEDGVFTWSRPQRPEGEWKLVSSAIPDIGNDPNPTVHILTAAGQTPIDITTEPELPSLFLVREKQDASELFHWILAVGDPEAANISDAHTFQVTGDAEFMVYVPNTRTDVFTSDSYFDSYRLAGNITTERLERIATITRDEMPPWARTRKDVRENCQHWTVRVVARLTAEGIVEKQKVKDIEALLQPVDL